MASLFCVFIQKMKALQFKRGIKLTTISNIQSLFQLCNEVSKYAKKLCKVSNWEHRWHCSKLLHRMSATLDANLLGMFI